MTDGDTSPGKPPVAEFAAPVVNDTPRHEGPLLKVAGSAMAWCWN